MRGPVTILEATPLLGESTRAAVAEAEAWLVGPVAVTGAEGR